MSKPSLKLSVIVAVFLLLAALHQDFWNWDRADLVLGFMPIGLFYHACYSITAAIFWAIVIKVAWPDRLEKWAEENDHD